MTYTYGLVQLYSIARIDCAINCSWSTTEAQTVFPTVLRYSHF